MKFKTAKRSAEELSDHKKQLDEMIISTVRGANGKLDRRGVSKLAEPSVKHEIAEVLFQLITDEVTVSDPVPFLVDEVDGDIRNQYVFQMLNSALRVTPRAYGSKPLSQRLTFKEWSMQTTMKEIAVELPLEEIASGRITPSLVAEQIAFAVNRYRIATVLDALDNAVPAATSDRTGKAGYTLRYVGLTKANLDNAIDGMADDGNTPSIMGRHIAMNPTIRGFGGWSQQTMYNLEQRGVLSMYLGSPIVTLSDEYSKYVGAHVIRNDRVYLAGQKKGAQFMTKDVSFLNYAIVDERTATFSTGIRIEDGLLVWDPYRYRIIEA